MVAYGCLCDQYATFSFPCTEYIVDTPKTKIPMYIYANNYVNVQHNQVDM